MKVTHVIRRLWLYDHNASHYGKENMYTFMLKNKRITLKPITTAKMDNYKVRKSFKSSVSAFNI